MNSEQGLYLSIDLFFSQQHVYMQIGHSVPIYKLPHYSFLKGNDLIYRNYLNKSWQYYFPNFSSKDIEDRVNEYYLLVDSIRRKGVLHPVLTFTRPNGDLMVYDGNHRAAVCKFYDIELPTEDLSLKEVIKRRTDIPNVYYGSKRKGMPYQTIYSPEGKIVLEGRRNNLGQRQAYIYRRDIVNKDVVDLGCNYGNSLILAEGAKSLTGIDVNADILTAAVRLAVIFVKDVNFVIHDLNVPLNMNKVFDTAFIFSIDAHLDSFEGLIYFIKNNVKKVIYYETHQGRDIPHDINKHFRDIEFRGWLGNRKFYRCLI